MHSRFSRYPLCRHTKTNGLTCKSPALRTSAFCHFHQKLHRTRPVTISGGPGLSTHLFHPLFDRPSIQRALSVVVSRLSTNQISTRDAGRMLFGLQMALSNLKSTSLE